MENNYDLQKKNRIRNSDNPKTLNLNLIKIQIPESFRYFRYLNSIPIPSLYLCFFIRLMYNLILCIVIVC